MNIIELVLIAFALSLDAFSVSITCGIKLHSKMYGKFFKIAVFFGLFQALMPIAGYYLTKTFLKEFVDSYANWVTFTIFFILAIKTFYDYYMDQNQKISSCCECRGYSCLTTLAVATSIDAFLVGSVIGIRSSSFFASIILIGVITFINSIIGCLLGNHSLTFFKDKSRILAGIILLILAFKAIF